MMTYPKKLLVCVVVTLTIVFLLKFVEDIRQNSNFARAKLGADWIVKAQKTDGLFIYNYYPLTNTYSNDDEIVRQAGAAYSLAIAAHYFNDEIYFERAKRAVDRLLEISQTRNVQNETARFIPFGGVIKSNAGAVLVLAILELAEKDPAILSSYRQYLEELANHLIFSVNPNKTFYDRYDPISRKYFRSLDIDFNNGESLLALAKMHKFFPERKYQKVIDEVAPKLMDMYGKKWNAGFYSWGVKAFSELYDQKTDSAYKESVFKLTDLMIGSGYFTQGETTIALGVFLEGLAPAYRLAKETKDPIRAKIYYKNGVDALKRLETLQITKKGEFSDETFAKSYGAFCDNIPCNNLRIDNTEHGVMALIFTKESGLTK